jgi:hypothetical protein
MVNNVGFNCKKAAKVKNWLQKFTGSGCWRALVGFDGLFGRKNMWGDLGLQNREKEEKRKVGACSRAANSTSVQWRRRRRRKKRKHTLGLNTQKSIFHYRSLWNYEYI